jgi:Uma2 family endonuclease
MSPATTQQPGFLAFATFRRFTVDEYHTMIRTGVFTDGEPLELLEGYVVHKMSRGKPHDFAVQALTKRFVRMLPPGWDVRVQCAITLPDSEPEPDFALVRGDETVYHDHHPGPTEIGILVEVSGSSLPIDRVDKARVYARAGIPVYWVVNVVDKVVEVLTRPSGPTGAPAYEQRDDFPVGTAVPVVLGGNTVGTIVVADIMA